MQCIVGRHYITMNDEPCATLDLTYTNGFGSKFISSEKSNFKTFSNE